MRNFPLFYKNQNVINDRNRTLTRNGSNVSGRLQFYYQNLRRFARFGTICTI